uniref:Uncharacterized protein n=1 Tax=Ditylenchus dipsaci TaxID=166011 RepID=A0A915E9D4_9BILA
MLKFLLMTVIVFCLGLVVHSRPSDDLSEGGSLMGHGGKGFGGYGGYGGGGYHKSAVFGKGGGGGGYGYGG